AVSAQADTRLFAASADAYRRGSCQVDPEEVAALPPPAPSGWGDAGDPWAPESVAPLILFLLTDAASGVNGQVLGARGGDIYLYGNPAIERSIHSWGRRFTLDELEVLG